MPITTRATPASMSRSAASTERTPPPVSISQPTLRAMAATYSRLPASPLRAASRSTTWIQRAPAASNARATATGSSEYTVSAA